MKNKAILPLGPTGSGKTPLGDYLEERGLFGRRCVHFDFGEKFKPEPFTIQNYFRNRNPTLGIHLMKKQTGIPMRAGSAKSTTDIRYFTGFAAPDPRVKTFET
jgi:hypothetical protein